MKNKIVNLKKVILAGAFFLALNAFGQSAGAPATARILSCGSVNPCSAKSGDFAD